MGAFLVSLCRYLIKPRRCSSLIFANTHKYEQTHTMMTSSNGNIFRVTGHLCEELTGPGEFPAQRPGTRNFDVFFDLHPNKRFSKQSWGLWFETPSRPLWRHRDVHKRIHTCKRSPKRMKEHKFLTPLVYPDMRHDVIVLAAALLVIRKLIKFSY